MNIDFNKIVEFESYKNRKRRLLFLQKKFFNNSKSREAASTDLIKVVYLSIRYMNLSKSLFLLFCKWNSEEDFFEIWGMWWIYLVFLNESPIISSEQKKQSLSYFKVCNRP